MDMAFSDEMPHKGEGAASGPVYIPLPMLTAMVEHSRRAYPNEACGIVSGRGSRALKFYPTENAEQSPYLYSIPPEDIFRIKKEIAAAGQELLGIFHSHPASEAYPSHVDIKQAYYPEAVYLIASLAVDPPVVRGFHIISGQVYERPLKFI